MSHLIAAGHKVTAEAAREALWLGGNAFDASVAGCFAAMVAESTLTSAGGGGYLLAVPCEQPPSVFDFFVDMPSGPIEETIDFFGVDVDFGTTIQEFHIGRAAAGVPGNLAGLIEVQKTLGCLDLPDVLAPAIRAARKGVELNQPQSYVIRILEPILTQSEQGRRIYQRDGKMRGVGEELRMERFADFLETVGKEGAGFFYKGDGAATLVKWSEEGGGLITHNDLSQYRVKVRAPLRTVFDGYEVLLNPPPAQSGMLIELTLAVLQMLTAGETSRTTLDQLVKALDITNRIRKDCVPEIVSEETEIPLSGRKRVLDSIAEILQNEGQMEKTNPEVDSRLGSTTHLSVLDAEGNAASVTTTNGEGCGYLLPEFGFMLNNMLGEEDLNPHGFHKYPAGSRLSSMVAPTVVVKEGKPILVTGTAGSKRIRSVIVQILVNVLRGKLSLAESTAAPRVHLEGKILSVEPGFQIEELDGLRSRYKLELWDEFNLFFGGVNSVSCDEAVGDRRRGGFGCVVDRKDEVI